MIEFYGTQPPGHIQSFEIGGICPHCKRAGKWHLLTLPQVAHLQQHGVNEVVIDYCCILCRKDIPVRWCIIENAGNNMSVSMPQVALPAKEPFDFDYVPELVKKEIDEALDCLSVNAYHGFASVCRRTIQAISVNLGAGASTKIEHQIDEMIELSELEDEWKELAKQIMLSGHDGTHPHLAEMDRERSEILVSLMQDLTYQIYTRPEKVRAAAQLRKKAIQNKKSTE